jgi:hypothetical protein
MASPTRFLSGVTPAASFQPLGHCGVPDPFFYAQYDDDFIHYNSGDYTVTSPNSGTVAATAAKGSGGRILLTTGATGGNYCSLQLSTASFQIVAGKKLFYLVRLQVENITTQAILVGLCNTTTTPLSAVADGIYFSKAAASTSFVLTNRAGSATIGSTTITAAQSGFAAATDIDLGFYVDRAGNIRAFVGNSLEGAKRQNTATLGPNFGIKASDLTAAQTAVLLNPTLAVGNGATAAAITGTADFQFAAQER